MRFPLALAPALGLAAVLASALPASAGGVSVAAHQAKRITLSGSAADVVVGDPAVADVALVGPRTVVVIGKTPGVTSLLVFDRAQRVIFEGPVSVGAAGGQVGMVRGVEGGAPAQAQVYTCMGLCSTTKDR